MIMINHAMPEMGMSSIQWWIVVLHWLVFSLAHKKKKKRKKKQNYGYSGNVSMLMMFFIILLYKYFIFLNFFYFIHFLVFIVTVDLCSFQWLLVVFSSISIPTKNITNIMTDHRWRTKITLRILTKEVSLFRMNARTSYTKLFLFFIFSILNFLLIWIFLPKIV